ncbi:MAG TPA: DNA replication and repair protein RecF [Halothiobacillus sp.]|nr:DNA replication and repair protein RecF [Halothiobacillus sp.]HQS28534.1 DNA replication and repair protein RecF [Halothiobacillus sp.]
MANIASISVTNFRNLNSIDCEFSPGFNLLTGENGAGKTSLLEAIYFLGNLKSFRSQTHHDLIAQNQACAVVRASVSAENASFFMAVERCKERVRLKVDLEDIQSAGAFVAHLPVLSLHAQSDDLILGGPEFRRKFLDRTAFYLFPEFATIFSQFSRVLKQRNAALKNGQSTLAWDGLFIQYSTLLTEQRLAALDYIAAILPGVLLSLSPYLLLQVEYHQGFRAQGSLADSLARHAARERELGQTLSGPHRADLILSVNGFGVKSTASRGQIKIILLALYLSVAGVWRDVSNKNAILLFDDFISELDNRHASLLWDFLSHFGHQAFFSATDRNPLAHPFDAKFSLSAGKITSML